MEQRKKYIFSIIGILLAFLAVSAHYLFDPWGYYWKVSSQETTLREGLVSAAESWLGKNEADASHQEIIDLYNTQDPLPVDYVVQYTDSWCATFVSAAAMNSGLTAVIPTECGCERQIVLFQEIGDWVEDEGTIPLPGDLIYYDWDWQKPGDCIGWSDHVGIVVGTKWPFVKVIEGNKDDCVSYRVIPLWDIRIRGYAKPDYASLLK